MAKAAAIRTTPAGWAMSWRFATSTPTALPRAARRFPKAKPFTDFRKLLDAMHKTIDAATISTPDHIHAPAAAMAMRRGIHCFVQKPLTHSLHEARVLAQLAREQKLATQMGNQGSAESPCGGPPRCSGRACWER